MNKIAEQQELDRIAEIQKRPNYFPDNSN